MAKLTMSTLPWYGQLGAFVGAAAVMAGLFYYFVEIDTQTALTAKTAELTTIRDRVAKGVESARRLPEFRKQVGDLEARLEGLKPILPEEKDVGDLLRRIQTLAVQSNLVIKGFRPQAITTHDMHAEWPISLTLEGNYHNLGLFLDRVSKFPRIINIGSLSIEQKDPPVGGATMAITATATTFVLMDRSGDAADPAKKGSQNAPGKAPTKS